MARFSPMSRGCCPALAIHFVCLFALALAAGCSGSSTDTVAVACSGGVLCPEDATCTADGLGCTTTSCGNGVVDGDEECDDGNLSDDDGCIRGCKRANCGDGEVDLAAGEACDPGAPGTETATCDRDCTVAFCGDGQANAARGESCDTAGQSASCDADCTLAACGDGVPNVSAGEQCDDGNADDEDGCRNDCTRPACGDGVIGPGEGCDDGNGDDSDDCLSSCKAAECGDGATRAGEEECDDGNQIEGDNCLKCHLATCGDGVVDAAAPGIEQCDDGNPIDTDLCRADCTLAVCGDGVVRTGGADPESCDDGNTTDDGNGCSANCTRNAVCGDGVVQALFEQCDDGNTTAESNGCSATCQRVGTCGDGVVQALFEDCDDGDRVFTPANGCSADCKRTGYCGDGARQSLFEECDDGNSSNGDNCVTGCRLNVCGDGYRDNASPWIEPCDDGNGSNNDDCVTVFGGNCAVAACGDGFIDVYGPRTEACDPGSPGVSIATCDSDCTTPLCGDGLVNAAAGEICDNGSYNGEAGNACGATCKRTNGQACTFNVECGSGQCVNGYCFDPPPTITISSPPAEGATTSAISATFALGTSLPATICWRLDGSPQTCSTANVTSFSVSLPYLPDGYRTLAVTATNVAGNAASAARHWTVDTAAPTLTISSPPAEGARTNAISATFTLGTSEPATICWRLDGSPQTCSTAGVTSFSANLQNLPQGSHSLNVSATDVAGNAASATRNWTVDLTAPTLAISTPPAEGATTAAATASFTLGTNEPATICWRLDGSFSICSAAGSVSHSTGTLPISIGGHTLSVTATDSAGNVTNGTRNWTRTP